MIWRIGGKGAKDVKGVSEFKFQRTNRINPSTLLRTGINYGLLERPEKIAEMASSRLK
jgi:hypothetical protein